MSGNPRPKERQSVSGQVQSHSLVIKSLLNFFARNHARHCGLSSIEQERYDELEFLLVNVDEAGHGATAAQVKDLKRVLDLYSRAKGDSSAADCSLDVLNQIDRLVSP